MKTKKIIFLFLIITSLLVACNTFEKKQEVELTTEKLSYSGISHNDIPFEVIADIPKLREDDFGFKKLVEEWVASKNPKELDRNSNLSFEEPADLYSSNYIAFENSFLNILSIVYKTYEINTGEANGIEKNYTINIRDNKILSLDDVLREEEKERFFELLQKQMSEEFLVKRENLEELIKENYKFYFKDNNIVFLFDPYVITDGSLGTLEFEYTLN